MDSTPVLKTPSPIIIKPLENYNKNFRRDSLALGRRGKGRRTAGKKMLLEV